MKITPLKPFITFQTARFQGAEQPIPEATKAKLAEIAQRYGQPLELVESVYREIFADESLRWASGGRSRSNRVFETTLARGEEGGESESDRVPRVYEHTGVRGEEGGSL